MDFADVIDSCTTIWSFYILSQTVQTPSYHPPHLAPPPPEELVCLVAGHTGALVLGGPALVPPSRSPPPDTPSSLLDTLPPGISRCFSHHLGLGKDVRLAL